MPPIFHMSIYCCLVCYKYMLTSFPFSLALENQRTKRVTHLLSHFHLLSQPISVGAGAMFMADDMDSNHVPQQSRKHKLRIINQDYLQQPSPSFPFTSGYSPSIPEPSRTFVNAHSPSSFTATNNLIPDQFQSRNSQGLALSLSSNPCYDQNQWNSRSVNYEMLIRSPVPLGPFTGYASILNRSRFLKPAQQVLNDFCGVDCGVTMMMNSPLEESLSENGDFFKDRIACTDRVEHQWGNSRLVLLLEEVYKRYKQYCQQMQLVVTSFEAVSGLENAAPCISLAVKSLAKQFTCLKNVLLEQIQHMGRNNIGYTDGLRKEETNKKQVHNSVFPYPPVWRSQRGLPDHAVAVLKKWLFEHFLHPYPSDSDKHFLAHQTGLSRNQVSNWFINARVRLWKPMVEEIHMLETRQDERTSAESSDAAKTPNDNHADTTRTATDQNNGVSLALGLYQSELSVPFPMNMLSQHLGIDTDTGAYISNNFPFK